MIHFSCDRCQRRIQEDDVRYVLNMEVQATLGQNDFEDAEEARTHLAELQDILARLDEDECEELENELYQQKQFDLCPECYKKFMQDPFGNEANLQLRFSSN